jgi:hypothetical protein
MMTITHFNQPAHLNGKPMHTPWIMGPNNSSVIYDSNGSIVCDYNDEHQAELIVQSVNRAPAFDAMVAALEYGIKIIWNASKTMGASDEMAFENAKPLSVALKLANNANSEQALTLEQEIDMEFGLKK